MYVQTTPLFHSHMIMDCVAIWKFTNNQWRTDEEIKDQKSKAASKWKKDQEEKQVMC